MTGDLKLIKSLEQEIGKRLTVVYKRRQGFTAKDISRPSPAKVHNVLYFHEPERPMPSKRYRFNNFVIIDNNYRAVGIQLAGLRLTSIPLILSNMRSLRAIEIRSNYITNIHPDILLLPKLTYLCLLSNRINSIPQSMFNMKLQIRYEVPGEGRPDPYRGIFIPNNPLKSPPPEIISSGKHAIDAYFDSIKESDLLPLNELKIVLVGDGASGKTSLVKQLQGHKFNKNESQTHGIRIRRWKLETNDCTIYANLWDFGGQDIMHATHQFFLSRRSLYMLVLDCRKDEKTEYWLKHIKSFGGDSPIIIVLNKTDENPGFDVNRKFLKEKYPSIVGFFKVSCKTKDGIEGLSEFLLKTITEVEMLQTTWPSSWFKVKKQLEIMTRSKTRSKHYINYDQFIEVCEDAGVNDSDSQDVLVEFLNDLGVVLHFQDFELEDTHVLDPKWVTNGVYRIINAKILARQNGVFRLSQLRTILGKKRESDYSYPRSKYRYIVDLMKKFELCYQLDEKQVLVPDLLPVREAEFEFNYETALQYVVEYEFLPKAIIPRLLVSMHNDVQQNLAWRTGAVLNAPGFSSTALIRADEEEKRIYVYVDGGLKRDYLAVIRHALLTINESYQELGAKELVPCNCSMCSNQKAPNYFDYSALLKFRRKRMKKTACTISAEYVIIEDLLSGIEGSDISTEDEILRILLELQKNSESKESFLNDANEIIQLKPNIAGLGIDLNALANKLFKKKKKKKKSGRP